MADKESNIKQLVHKKYMQQCKYYKGEEKCPHKGNKALLWEYERAWVEMSTNNNGISLLMEYVGELNRAGLGQFASQTKMPITLLALLLMRYYHSTGYIPNDTSDFTELINSYYVEQPK